VNRFFVPAVLAATISGLGFGLVVGVIARSPETHANVRPEGYDRTPIAYLDEQATFDGLGLADPGLLTTADRVERGRLLFFGASCVTCHGLANQGGVIGPALDVGDLTVSDLRRAIQAGPKGMPVFPEEMFSEEDLEALYAFLEALLEDAPAASAESTSSP
jgi:mono/diheme cytochrome c family protein